MRFKFINHITIFCKQKENIVFNKKKENFNQLEDFILCIFISLHGILTTTVLQLEKVYLKTVFKHNYFLN